MAAVLCCKLTRLRWVCNQQQLTCHRGCKRNLLPASQAPLIFSTAPKATVAMSCTDTQRVLFCAAAGLGLSAGLVPQDKVTTGSAEQDSPEVLVSHRSLLCVLPSIHTPCQPDQLQGGCSWAAPSTVRCRQPEPPTDPQGESQPAHCLSTPTWHFSHFSS